jgi:hypothetical protein
MYIKVHSAGGKKTLAVCDAELMGRVLAGGGRMLDLKKHAGFYKGKKAKNAAEVAALLGECDSANIVGKKCVQIAIDKGVISTADVISIGGIPHVQVYRLSL